MANFHLFEVLRKSADQYSSDTRPESLPCIVCDARDGKVYRYDTCMTDEFVGFEVDGTPKPKNDNRPGLSHVASIPEDKMVYFKYSDGKKANVAYSLQVNENLTPDEKNRVRKAHEERYGRVPEEHYGTIVRSSFPSPL